MELHLCCCKALNCKNINQESSGLQKSKSVKEMDTVFQGEKKSAPVISTMSIARSIISSVCRVIVSNATVYSIIFPALEYCKTRGSGEDDW